jgi:competence protein ComEA
MRRLSFGLIFVVAAVVILIAIGSLPPPAMRVERLATAADSGVIRQDGRLLIDLNRADVQLLEAVPGVGPAIAERIRAYIDEKGALKAPEELLNVDGIGPNKLRAIEEMTVILPPG